MHQDGYKISQAENDEAMKIPNWLIRVQAKKMADKKRLNEISGTAKKNQPWWYSI